MAAIRFALAGVILLAWDLLRNPQARRMPSRRQLLDSFLVGALLLGIGNGFVVFGEKTVPSGIAAILIAMMPLWFAILGWLYFRDKLPKIVAFAIAVGFAGTALLIWPVGQGANSFDPVGIVILLIAPLGWAHGSLYSIKKASLPPSGFTASGLQMLAGAIVTGIEAVIAGEPAQFHPEQISTASILAVVYLVFIGSMLAFTSYAWLLKHAPLSLIGTYACVNPVVAVFLGSVFLHEEITVRTIVASAVILVAVAIIVAVRARLQSGAEGTEASDEVGSPAFRPAADPRQAPSD
jgi:drug/metabolite transporter (DMT)-like permease